MREFKNEMDLVARIVWCAVIFCCALCVGGYLLSGLYVVNTQQMAVKFRFGKVVNDRISPGIHYRFPWPVESVTRVGTKEMRRIQAGFGADPDRLEDIERSMGRLDNIEGGTYWVPYCLTGDKNIIHVKVIVNYQVSEPPSQYLLAYRNPDLALTMMTQSCIIQAVSRYGVDFILTTGKLQIQQDIVDRLKALAESRHLGLRVLSVEIKNTRPPSQVAQAFMEVINAQEAKSTAIHDAESYESQTVNDATGQAARLLAEAAGYREKRIKAAEAEQERFLKLAKEYDAHPGITGERLRLQALGEILSKASITIVDEEEGQDVVNLKLMGKPSGSAQNPAVSSEPGGRPE